jgi:hypothetical protein
MQPDPRGLDPAVPGWSRIEIMRVVAGEAPPPDAPEYGLGTHTIKMSNATEHPSGRPQPVALLVRLVGGRPEVAPVEAGFEARVRAVLNDWHDVPPEFYNEPLDFHSGWEAAIRAIQEALDARG